ncbi:hypothetical protein OPT61_g1217 [Boeremia exigua]|uniref:Uncharacterized protein n=1 Tax=Boeremia exigua TaxID=749465 RepID=A0ACC2IQZ9_9PLEO|nr:hypothetical protein OPT61_g1217 [Boeremia exigua]
MRTIKLLYHSTSDRRKIHGSGSDFRKWVGVYASRGSELAPRDILPGVNTASPDEDICLGGDRHSYIDNNLYAHSKNQLVRRPQQKISLILDGITMRVTRGAVQRAQQDAEEPAGAPGHALEAIEPNTSPVTQDEEPLPAKTIARTPAKKAKGKGAKKGTKAKKMKTEDKEVTQVNGEAEQHIAVSSADTAAEQEPTTDHMNGAAEAANINEQPQAPQNLAGRLTRRQLAKLEEEEALRISQHAPGPKNDATDTVARHPTSQITEITTEDSIDATPRQKQTTVAQAQLTHAEPELATRPAQRTRFEQTNLGEERPAIHVIKTAKESATEKSEVVIGAKEAVLIEHDEMTPPHENPAEPACGSATKQNRLVRHQQEKPEVEQHQAPRSKSTLNEDLHNTTSDVPTELIVQQEEEGCEEFTKNKANDNEDNVALAAIVEMELDKADECAAERTDDVGEVKSPPSVRSQTDAYASKASKLTKPDDYPNEAIQARPATPTDAEFDADLETRIDVSAADEVVPSEEFTLKTEPEMLCDKEPPQTSEASISAIDRLEGDLECIGKAIPDLDKPAGDITSNAPRRELPVKTPMKPSKEQLVRSTTQLTSKTSSKTLVKVPTKNAPGGSKISSATNAPPSAKVSKVPGAAPKSVKSTTTTLSRASSVRNAPSKNIERRSTETTDYLASKRRPISLSFPTPPPPPKGRAPTKPVFQLSSDSVAAKLRAQKEERLKREVGDAVAPNQRPISMPPLAKSTKRLTVPSFQLPGEATAARLKAQKDARLKRVEQAGGGKKLATRPISMPSLSKSTKPTTKPSFQLPGEATAARLKAQKEERQKRMEEAEAAKKAAPVRKPIVHQPRKTLLTKDAPEDSTPPAPRTDASQSSGSVARKRSITKPSALHSTSTSSTNRSSVLPVEGGRSISTSQDAAALKIKGTQILNRDKRENEAMDHERKTKEEAAKRARAEAAERGRIASREWAERQRQKMKTVH